MSPSQTAADDFVVYNVPALMSRKVTKLDPATGAWIPDDTWYKSTRTMMEALVRFFERNGLLVSPGPLPAIENVALRLSGFTERGQRFVKSGAVEKWMAAFDRSGSRKARDDVAYLEKKLAELAP